HLVHRLHPHAKQGAPEVLLAPALFQLACQRFRLPVSGDGQEAVPPAVPGRREAARHALGPQRFEGSGQQGLLFGTHSPTLLVVIRTPVQAPGSLGGDPEAAPRRRAPPARPPPQARGRSLPPDGARGSPRPCGPPLKVSGSSPGPSRQPSGSPGRASRRPDETR